MATGKPDWVVLGTFILSLAGCHSVKTPPVDKPAMWESPPATVTEKIEQILPLVLEWYTRTERQLLPLGRSLTQTERQRARELGVRAPQEVRVVVLQQFPMPDNEYIRREAIKHGIGSPDEGGRTHGYAIMLKPEYQDDSLILYHELVHVAQQDRMGREAFLRQYLTELETLGYARSPLELEAYARQGRIDR